MDTSQEWSSRLVNKHLQLHPEYKGYYKGKKTRKGFVEINKTEGCKKEVFQIDKL